MWLTLHWLQVLSWGLQCGDWVKPCAAVYCRWLGVLLPPERREEEQLCPGVVRGGQQLGRRLLSHIARLFTQHKAEATGDWCVWLLRRVEAVCRAGPGLLEPQTWDVVLRLVLGAADSVLVPPGPPSQLSQAAVAVLLHCWLSACSDPSTSFPWPALWRTFAARAAAWRHRIEVWRSLLLCLTRH